MKRHEWLALALWAGAILFCAQFALASGDELEPQAAVLGWVLVAILTLGGLAMAGARRERNRRRD